ncbi:hypothetical protein AKJ09_05700 [Labilithrix luteola]|uniref:Uncharacterized protein n=1 Tax=Labilithrix luteola TaxID=1391654 RepID=A0A0K1Q069_9BACT|nr:hypothetical protein AKJ09_05700 [Labilithrix luteola]
MAFAHGSANRKPLGGTAADAGSEADEASIGASKRPSNSASVLASS